MCKKEILKKMGLFTGIFAAGIMGFVAIGCAPEEPEEPVLPDDPVQVPQPEPMPDPEPQPMPQPDDEPQQLPELPELQ